MRMGQQGREGEGKAMAGTANDRAEPHRQGDGRQGARACEGFTSALAGRPAPVQAQAAFAGQTSRTVPTAPRPRFAPGHLIASGPDAGIHSPDRDLSSVLASRLTRPDRRPGA